MAAERCRCHQLPQSWGLGGKVCCVRAAPRCVRDSAWSSDAPTLFPDPTYPWDHHVLLETQCHQPQRHHLVPVPAPSRRGHKGAGHQKGSFPKFGFQEIRKFIGSCGVWGLPAPRMDTARGPQHQPQQLLSVSPHVLRTPHPSGLCFPIQVADPQHPKTMCFKLIFPSKAEEIPPLLCHLGGEGGKESCGSRVGFAYGCCAAPDPRSW